MSSLCLLSLALIAACLGSRGVAKAPYWTKVAAVGLGWLISVAFVPV